MKNNKVNRIDKSCMRSDYKAIVRFHYLAVDLLENQFFLTFQTSQQSTNKYFFRDNHYTDKTTKQAIQMYVFPYRIHCLSNTESNMNRSWVIFDDCKQWGSLELLSRLDFPQIKHRHDNHSSLQLNFWFTIFLYFWWKQNDLFKYLILIILSMPFLRWFLIWIYHSSVSILCKLSSIY